MCGWKNKLVVSVSIGLGLMAGSGVSSAVEGESLVTDRPDFTESAETIPRGRAQVEAGVTFEQSGDSRARSFGEVLVRVATGKRSEVRIGVPSHLRVHGDGAKVSGFDDAFLGAKFVLQQGARRKPQVAVLAGSTLPTGSRRVAERKYQPEVVLAASIELTERTSLATNLGVVRASDEGKRFNQLFGSISLGHSLGGRWGSYLEVYGFNRSEPGGPSQKYINGGLTYLVNNDFQLDARLGCGLHGGPREKFFGFGAARRF